METPNDTQLKERGQELRVRAPRGRVAGLRRNHVRVAVALLALIVGMALVVGLGIDLFPSRGPAERPIDPPRDTRPSMLAALPNSYADIPTPKEPAAPPSTPPMEDDTEEDALAALRAQNEELRRNIASMMAAIEGIDAEKQKLLDQLARLQDEAAKDQARAWASPVLVKLDQREARRDEAAAPAHEVKSLDPWMVRPDEPVADATDRVPPTDQERKRAFLQQSAAPGVHLDQPYLHPRSPYEIQAGTVIPAALLTGINTDLPGDVVAVVTAPVYDSRTGKHLLIPQGARLYGAYDSEIANGQNRALLVWHRLLMPNGRSIVLDRMAGVDAAGYAGVADRVDYHVKKLAAGAVLSGVIAYAGNLARAPGSRSGDGDRYGVDVVGDTVAQEASRIGSKIIDRQLDVQPTITVRPGWPVHVLVNRDIALEPYRP